MNKKFIDIVSTMPENAGVYQMYDKDNNLLYIGKAKNLKKRLSQYIDTTKLPGKKALMVSLIDNVKIKITQNEQEALILEQQLIKEYKPKYNVVMMDSKMYPFLMISDDEFPRLIKYRGKITNNKNVFGPFPDVGKLNETIKIIQRVFKLRSCKNTMFKNRIKPCLLYQLGKCSAPCCNNISKSDYQKSVNEVKQFLSGNTEDIINNLYKQMTFASEKEEYELAKIYRDKISALNSVINMKTKNVFDTINKENQRITAIIPDLQDFTNINKISRIDVFDNSHLFSKNAVGGMIVVNQNGFDKKEYRHYKLNNKSVAGNDIGMMEEFLTRRYTDAMKKNNLPDLIILDGGLAQFNIGQKVLNNLNLNIPIMGVVKGEVRSGDEHFILPNGEIKNLDKQSLLFQTLGLIRDEAHRFAISFHKKTRAKDFISSALDEIEGIGSFRKKLLLKHFGNIENISNATINDLLSIKGISQSTAKKIYGFFHSDLII